MVQVRFSPARTGLPQQARRRQNRNRRRSDVDRNVAQRIRGAVGAIAVVAVIEQVDISTPGSAYQVAFGMLGCRFSSRTDLSKINMAASKQEQLSCAHSIRARSGNGIAGRLANTPSQLMPKLAGEPLQDISGLNPVQRILATDLAAFLNELHDPDRHGLLVPKGMEVAKELPRERCSVSGVLYLTFR
ncbi:hypothetical protein [Neoaquamicrobium sediminum]|uniref:hypothetical protein n=1 Tax=Neoaquamicrobium sediminum TaxID=1849104 RepID=UPI0015661A26|nr:hypothetical protein [Mesorhizobium sediminum]NRC57398.1 hypothetical protein [Mesorhizobium sediminum]